MSFYVTIIVYSLFIFIVSSMSYYFIYAHYINLENRRFKLPDVKFVVIILLLLGVLSSTILISNHQETKQIKTEMYEIDLPKTFSDFDFSEFIDEIENNVKPDDNIIYTTRDDFYINVNYDESIRDMYLSFYIIRGNKIIEFTIDYTSYNSDKRKITVAKTYEFDKNLYNHDEPLPLKELLTPLEKLSIDHIKDSIQFTNADNFMMFRFSKDTTEHDFKYAYHNFERPFMIDNEGTIARTEDGEYSGQDYAWVEITKMIKTELSFTSGEQIVYTSSSDPEERVEYLIKK